MRPFLRGLTNRLPVKFVGLVRGLLPGKTTGLSTASMREHCTKFRVSPRPDNGLDKRFLVAGGHQHPSLTDHLPQRASGRRHYGAADRHRLQGVETEAL